MTLNDKEKTFYKKHGYLIRRLCDRTIEDLLAARNEIYQMGLIFDPSFDPLSAKHVESVNRLGFYKALRKSLLQRKILTDPTLLSIAADLGVKSPISGPSGFRVDIHQESSHEFGWHQDYPCILGSQRQITLWIPLYEVKKEINTISILQNSHNEGLVTHVARGESGSLNLVIPDRVVAALTSKYEKIDLDLPFGSIVILSAFTVHRSTYVSPGQPRYTIINRVDDLSDTFHINNGLKTSDEGFNIFKAPEYCQIGNT